MQGATDHVNRKVRHEEKLFKSSGAGLSVADDSDLALAKDAWKRVFFTTINEMSMRSLHSRGEAAYRDYEEDYYKSCRINFFMGLLVDTFKNEEIGSDLCETILKNYEKDPIGQNFTELYGDVCPGALLESIHSGHADSDLTSILFQDWSDDRTCVTVFATPTVKP